MAVVSSFITQNNKMTWGTLRDVCLFKKDFMDTVINVRIAKTNCQEKNFDIAY